MSVPKVFILLLSLLASVTALATPHISRSTHHRALAGRVPVPALVDAPALPIRKRQNSKRCRPRSSAVQLVPTPKSPSHTSEPATPPTSFSPPPKSTAQPDAPATTRKTTTSHDQPPAAQPKFVGQGTFYATGLGACGITNKDTDFIVAVSHEFFDTFPNYKGGNPNNNPICGRRIKAEFEGKEVIVVATDRCEGCKRYDLDFSPSAFGKLADFARGRIDGVKWTML